MEISFCTAPGNFRRDIGYGNASWNIINSLQTLGYKVPYDDRRSPVQLNFAQPEWYHLRDEQFKIGYTPWESSQLPDAWPKKMNECDEVWTTSEICRDWFVDAGVKEPIYIYQHGVEDIWKTVKLRKPNEKLKFLHIGEPAQRKGGQMALDCFLEAFKGTDDVHLTIKAFAHSTIRVKDRQGNIIAPISDLKNVTLLDRVMDPEELLRLILSHDALIYPSYGEGFGLIPLQAMATGMPAVVTEWWAPYKKFILPLKYQVGESPWELMHHGKVAHPSRDNLIEWYKDLYQNFDKYAKVAYNKTPILHREYDWKKLTADMFTGLEKRL